MNKEVKLFRLMQGIDMIGMVAKTTDSTIYLSKALFIQMYQDKQNGEVHVSFQPVTETFIGNFSGEDRYLDIDLNRSAILFTYEPNPQLQENYEQAVSGIQIAHSLPPSKL